MKGRLVFTDLLRHALGCPQQANALIDLFRSNCVFGKLPYYRFHGQVLTANRLLRFSRER